MKPLIFSLCMMLCWSPGHAREPQKSTQERGNAASLQTNIITLKGFPLRLAEGYLKRMFGGALQCSESGDFARFGKVCRVDTRTDSELQVLDRPALEYHFYLAANELVGLSIHLDSANYEDIATAFTEKYGKPSLTREGAIELATGGERPTQIMIWKRGFQVLSLEQHHKQITTMRITLIAKPYDEGVLTERE